MPDTKKIPAERVKEVEALLRRTLLLVGRLALKRKLKVWPYMIHEWEQELAFCLEELNDMQTSLAVSPEPGDQAGEKNA